MSILITGGAGYIGSHTCVELLKNAYDIVVVDNYSNSHPESLLRVQKITGKRFPFYELDVTDEKLLGEIFQQHDIDCVIHFAGLKAVGESVQKPIEYYDNNINCTLALCKVMKNYNVKKFVFSSSATVYRADNPMPLTEKMALGCTNPYGWTKFMCEQILRDIAVASDGWSIALLRYFNPIGAHESGEIGEDPNGIPNNLLPYIAQTAIGKQKILSIYGDDYDTIDGTGLRDYIHVVDLAQGHVAAVDYLTKHQGVEAFNLGTGTGTSVLQMVEAFERVNHVKVPYQIVGRRQGDLAVCYADSSKAAELLHWRAEKSLDEMCADLWHWQKKNPYGYEGK